MSCRALPSPVPLNSFLSLLRPPEAPIDSLKPSEVPWSPIWLPEPGALNPLRHIPIQKIIISKNHQKLQGYRWPLLTPSFVDFACPVYKNQQKRSNSDSFMFDQLLMRVDARGPSRWFVPQIFSKGKLLIQTVIRVNSAISVLFRRRKRWSTAMTKMAMTPASFAVISEVGGFR